MRHVIGLNHGAGKDRNDNTSHLITGMLLHGDGQRTMVAGFEHVSYEVEMQEAKTQA